MASTQSAEKSRTVSLFTELAREMGCVDSLDNLEMHTLRGMWHYLAEHHETLCQRFNCPVCDQIEGDRLILSAIEKRRNEIKEANA